MSAWLAAQYPVQRQQKQLVECCSGLDPRVRAPVCVQAGGGRGLMAVQPLQLPSMVLVLLSTDRLDGSHFACMHKLGTLLNRLHVCVLMLPRAGYRRLRLLQPSRVRSSQHSLHCPPSRHPQHHLQRTHQQLPAVVVAGQVQRLEAAAVVVVQAGHILLKQQQQHPRHPGHLWICQQSRRRPSVLAVA